MVSLASTGMFKRSPPPPLTFDLLRPPLKLHQLLLRIPCKV